MAALANFAYQVKHHLGHLVAVRLAYDRAHLVGLDSEPFGKLFGGVVAVVAGKGRLRCGAGLYPVRHGAVPKCLGNGLQEFI